jgi:N-acetylmuramoyl-L-alanine amidase/PKD repeat protein
MEKLLKILKVVGIFLFIFIFYSSMLLLPAGNTLSAAGNGIKVFIDPGHGGKDPGAVWNGLKEKDANLAIANKLKTKLEAAGFTVVMRRTGDQYHTLDEIVSMANNSKADIFISIHNNASVSTSANGTETYWCPNGVNGSSQLANLVQSRLLSQIGRANRGVKTANFRVIKYTNMPAALVECAFVSNPTEAELLKTSSFQEKCAVGLFNAINEFSKGINKDTGSYTGGGGDGSAGFSVIVDYPRNNATISSSFVMSGWAADLKNNPPKKLAKVEIYKGTERNESNFLGTCSRFNRPDLGRSDILDSGYMLRINIDSLAKGENILGVYAYDANGNYSYNMVKINVVKEDEQTQPPNSIPVANPGGPYEGTVGQEITFDGSASTDSDGTIAEYNWDFGDGSSGSGAGPVHTYSEAGTYTVKLTVKDDKGAVSATVQVNVIIYESEEDEDEEEEDSDEDGVTTVSNSTVVVGYRELTAGQLISLFENRDSDKIERATRLAALYIKYGKLFDIRADIAWAQMCHETGFLEFTGDVKPEQNNFCGMGAVGGGAPGNSFATEELGVIAHYAHLAWYYYPDHVNEYCNNQYDPRHFDNSHYRYTGDTTLGFLNGRWAPGATYTDKIVLFANEVWQGSDGETDIEDYIVTANAGVDQSANVGDELTFDASASIISPVAEAGTITYQWDLDNDGVYDITTEDLTVKHLFDDAGEYEVKLKVTAFEDIESTDTVEVKINAYPTADPGGPYEGEVDEEITFDGSASVDSDGTIAEYIWDFGDGDSGSGESPIHTYSEAGTYTVSLAVKDDAGASSVPESTEVVIGEESEQTGEGDEDGDEEDGDDDEGDDEGTENVAPTADPGGPYEGEVDEEITFDGSASVDSDGTIAEYIWDFGDGDSGSGVNPVHTYTEAGSYTVTLTVKDDSDELSDEESKTVTITEADVEDEEEDEGEDEPQEAISREIGKNAGPFTMIVDYPKNNGDVSGRVVISGWAADLKNKNPIQLAKVEIYNGQGRYEHNFIGYARIFRRPDLGRISIINSGYILGFSLESIPEGENTLYIYAYDSNNNYRCISIKVNVIKEEASQAGDNGESDSGSSDGEDGDGETAGNAAPTASPGGPYTGTAGREITFDGSASSDSDGTIAEYIWDFGDGTSGAGAKPVHTYSKAGTYTLTLKVKDNSGSLSDAATTGATIKEAEKTNPANTSPITNSTSMVGYTEVTADQLVKLFIDRNSSKVERARRIAPLYIKYGKLFNIRADIAWAMMCHETGFLEYTGDVKPEQNNFCGMGAVGGGVPGNSFSTEELGVIAHYAHLAWYYYPGHVNEYCSSQYDPRHFGSGHYKYTGDTTLGFLNGRWAPGATYTGKIILFANQIYGF